jgi:hypothetical protein
MKIMKKQILFLCFGFILTLFFVACNKQDAPPPASKRVIKAIEPNQVLNLTYDDQKRLIKMEQILKDSTKFSTTTYDYSQPNKITELAVTPSQGTRKILYELDNQGKVVKASPQDPITNVVDTSKSTIIVYNSESQVIKVIDPQIKTGNPKQVYSYTNGNLTKKVYSTYYDSGVQITNYEDAYEYNLDIKNTLDYEHYGRINLYGKGNTNAISKHTFTGEQYNNGTTTRFSQIDDLTYELDSDGNITKRTVKETHFQGTAVLFTQTMVYSYVYQ